MTVLDDYFSYNETGWKCKICNHQSKEKSKSTTGRWKHAKDKHSAHEILGPAVKSHFKTKDIQTEQKVPDVVLFYYYNLYVYCFRFQVFSNSRKLIPKSFVIVILLVISFEIISVLHLRRTTILMNWLMQRIQELAGLVVSRFLTELFHQCTPILSMKSQQC